MLPGGGIGPELMSYVREIFRYCGVPVDFEIVEIDPNSEGNDDLEYAITSIKRNGVAIKGECSRKQANLYNIHRTIVPQVTLKRKVNKPTQFPVMWRCEMNWICSLTFWNANHIRASYLATKISTL